MSAWVAARGLGALGESLLSPHGAPQSCGRCNWVPGGLPVRAATICWAAANRVCRNQVLQEPKRSRVLAPVLRPAGPDCRREHASPWVRGRRGGCQGTAGRSPGAAGLRAGGSPRPCSAWAFSLVGKGLAGRVENDRLFLSQASDPTVLVRTSIIITYS